MSIRQLCRRCTHLTPPLTRLPTPRPHPPSRTFHITRPSLAQPPPQLRNAAIPFKTLTIISQTGENLGTQSLRQTLASLDLSTHDLILVSPTPTNPVAKIISKKEELDRAREARLKQKEKNAEKLRPDVLKELEIGSNISVNDMAIKLKKVRSWFEKGYRVQFTLVFKGKGSRNNAEVLEDLKRELEGVGTVAAGDPPTQTGKKMIVKFVPLSTAKPSNKKPGGAAPSSSSTPAP
ncbi:Translation initiation factor IF-3, mitochondrial [Rhizophlyctis rosea]|nr:Translation initiation factor IF-3, mitochondrial [Rhizophlyctis rosea]